MIRGWVIPLLPDEFLIRNSTIEADIIIAILLMLVMFYTAIRTLTSRREPSTEDPAFMVVALFGVLTGTLSGLIGAGGGFIIVPILLRLGLPMKKAVGTSMFIITIQSMVALIGDIFNPKIIEAGGINWTLLSIITILTVGGVLIGNYLQKLSLIHI